jgi:hypothetical protein
LGYRLHYTWIAKPGENVGKRQETLPHAVGGNVGKTGEKHGVSVISWRIVLPSFVPDWALRLVTY